MNPVTTGADQAVVADPGYVAAVRAFLDARYPRRVEELVWGQGDDRVVGVAFADAADESAELDAARRFQRELFDAGLAWAEGPRDLGGAGLGPAESAALRAVCRDYDLPDTDVFHVGQAIVAPALVRYGSPEQNDRWLRELWRGGAIGCQLFSEPDAGSDLASLQTRATAVDGGWVVSGQKVWSSGAHLNQVGELLARTGDDPALRHKGLSMFLLDMASPGVTVRPLKQMTGNAHFCEVFLDDVFVPEDALLGDLGSGWSVALESLDSERDDLTGLDETLFLHPMTRVVQLARAAGRNTDPVLRQRLADLHIRHRTTELLGRRIRSGATGPVERAGASLVKLSSTDHKFDLSQVAMELAGAAGVADSRRWGFYSWSLMDLGVFATRIAGGTDEVQRNLIAERGLGLPREPKVTA